MGPRSESPTLRASVSQLLVGTGVSLLYVNTRRGAVAVRVGRSMRLLFAFAFGVLGYFVAAVPTWHQGLLTRRVALGVVAAYAAFVVAFSATSLTAPS